MSPGDALESFKAKHNNLLSNPNKSDIGNAVADLERHMEPGELRTQAAQWVYDCLESCGMLNEHTNRNPTSYGERLRTLFEETD